MENNKAQNFTKHSNSEINFRKLFDPNNYQIENSETLVFFKNDYVLRYYKSNDELRKSYLEKLLSKKVWNPNQKQKTYNSIIIFDWDDTLLCSSYLFSNGVLDRTLELFEKDKEKIKILDEKVYNLLNMALEKGDVYIVTNSEPGWVEYSCQKFYPSVSQILSKIQIISARGKYETKYPGNLRKWKIYAFLNLIKRMNTELVTNIVCLGDSFIEIYCWKNISK